MHSGIREGEEMYLRSETSGVTLSFYMKEMTSKKVLQICSSGRGFPRQGGRGILEADSGMDFLASPCIPFAPCSNYNVFAVKTKT